jgi:DNA-binding GntR family transcriptional regulator
MSPTSKKSVAVKNVTLSVDVIASRIRNALLKGVLIDEKGNKVRISPGDRIDLNLLKQHLQKGLARGERLRPIAIRNACQELEREWLLKVHPKVGTTFLRPESDQVRRTMGLRVSIEAYVASRLPKFADFADKMELIKAHHKELQSLAEVKASEDQYLKADYNFHSEIFRQAGHTQGIQLLDTLRSWTAVTVQRSFTNEHLNAVNREHENIIKAIEQAHAHSASGDPLEAAVAAIFNRLEIEWAYREHLKNSVIRAFPQDPEPDPNLVAKFAGEKSAKFLELVARFVRKTAEEPLKRNDSQRGSMVASP